MKKLTGIHNKTKNITEELSPYNNINILLTDNDLNNFFKEHDINYSVKNINLFRNAFVHKSYCCMKNTSFTTSNISCPEDCLPLQDMPKFLETNVSQNNMQKIFTYIVKDRDNNILGSANGNTKKDAENNCAYEALKYYGEEL